MPPDRKRRRLAAEVETILADFVEQPAGSRREVAGDETVGAGPDPDRLFPSGLQPGQRKTVPLPAVRRNQPDVVAEVEPLRGADGDSGFRPLRHPADGDAERTEPRGIDQRRILLPHIKSARRTPGGGRMQQFLRLRQQFRRRIDRAVEQHPVGFHRLPDVIGGAQPPLDFERRHPDPTQFRQQRNTVKVARRQEESPFAADFVIPAARLFAFAPVPAPAALRRRQQTPPRKRTAERTVEEHLQFQIGMLRDSPQLFQRQLPFENHTADAEPRRRCHARRIVNSHLGRSVQRQRRKVLPRHRQHAEILHDQRVRAEFDQFGQILRRLRQLVLPEECIERQLELPPPVAGEFEQP
ncbi:hypothetical protein SDC9_122188 [bioreactor metagenome]|uniref:Uncharacterized protein n=1 Tax=bioreactor metagenome TaxID=1076179 RepID=A0A645CE14_9ZZZZ